MQAEATLLKTLADPTRLRLTVMLAINGETCVCELAAGIDAPDFRVSRNLAIMKDRGVVEVRREGTWMHYRLAKPRSKLEECLQDCFRDCLAEHPDAVADLQRLHAYKERQGACDAGDRAECIPPAARKKP